jgi:ankyrin repeat protein
MAALGQAIGYSVSRIYMKTMQKKLLAAVRAGKRTEVQRAIEAGAEVDVVNSLGESILNDASPEIAELLLAAGTNPNHVPSQWNPPLHLAAANGQVKKAEVLLAHGAKVNLRNSEGDTPLIVAAKGAQTEMVRWLLAAGAKLKLANAEGNRAIHTICRSHSKAAEKIVSLLLDAGEDPDARDTSRRTPLMSACYFGNLPVVQLLLRRGADVNAKDRFGWTAVMSAIRGEHAKIVDLLLKAGADLACRVSTKHMNKSVAACNAIELAEQSSKAVQLLLMNKDSDKGTFPLIMR